MPCFIVRLADGGGQRIGVDELTKLESEFLGEEFGSGVSPGAFVADFSFAPDFLKFVVGGNFGEGESVLGEVGAVGIGGCLAEEDDVVFGRSSEGEGVFEIGGEFVQSLWGGPGRRGGGGFDVGVEPVEVGAASAGGLEAFELGDEVFVEPGFATAFIVEGSHAFGADGREGEVELFVPGVPIGLRVFFPAAEPFHAVADVGDFVVVDLVEDLGGLGIARLSEDGGVVFGVVEVGLLEGEGKSGDVVERALHVGDVRPDHGAEVVVAEVDAAFLHSLEIPAGVVLLFLKGAQDAAAKGVGGIGEFEKGEGHELDGEEFMVGEEVEEDGALFFVVQLVGGGKGRFSVVGLGAKMFGAAGEVGGFKAAAFRGIEDEGFWRVGEFLLEGVTHEHPLGKIRDCRWIRHRLKRQNRSCDVDAKQKARG